MRERHTAVFDTIGEDGRTTAKAIKECYDRRGEKVIVKTFTDSQGFLRDFCDRRYDMAFLALNSPLDLAVARGAGLADKNCPLVFVSSTGDYAIEAFNLAALDYLLKPVTRERAEKSVSRIASEPVYQRKTVRSKTFLEEGSRECESF
ncbi:MAG: hypothetical protein FWF44_09905 [Defluviitaleaceae bacterium]|nr:hypothetical protein [Defluviitaleaceae bacterium]